jgi:hypothetical protein
MPDRDVKTIRDQIYFQYAKIIACSALECSNGKEAKAKGYGFVKTAFRDLKTGKKKWSDITHEDRQFVESDKRCIYCGSEAELDKEHIVPKSLKIKPGCAVCDRIQGIHNQVWACRTCNSSKLDKGLYEFFKHRHPNEKKYYDIIPALAEKKYLKTIYSCHECAGTLDKGAWVGAEISVLDIDYVVHLNK